MSQPSSSRQRRGRYDDVSQTNQRLGISSLRANHRAGALEESIPIVVASHQRMAGEWPVECPRLAAMLNFLRFDLISCVHNINLEPNLLTALLERWPPMTNTFHLPVGEMTITLQDVGVILGINIDGPAFIGHPVVGPGRRWETWEDCCDELLGEHPLENIEYEDPYDPSERAIFKMGVAKTHAQIPLRWLRWRFRQDSYATTSTQHFEYAVRAYIMYMLGTLLLPDISGSHVVAQYLPLLEDFGVFPQYSLGSSVLGYLYREMYLASKPKRTYLGGCLHLLQVWSWEHIYIGRPRLYPPGEDNLVGRPLAYRWAVHLVREMPHGNLLMFRDMFDGLQQTQVIWEPYSGTLLTYLPHICTVGINLWRASVPLISWKRVELHLPHRVMRQFGGVQSTDIAAVPDSFPLIDGRGRAGTDWIQEHAAYLAIWEARYQHITEITLPRGDGSAELRTYLRWYKSWATLYLLRPSVIPPDTYRVSAPTERLMLDYYHRSRGLINPYVGENDPSTFYDLTDMINEVNDLAQNVESQIYLDYTSYDPPAPPRRSATARKSTSGASRRSAFSERGESSTQETYETVSATQPPETAPETVPTTQSPEHPERPPRERRSPSRFTFSWPGRKRR